MTSPRVNAKIVRRGQPRHRSTPSSRRRTRTAAKAALPMKNAQTTRISRKRAALLPSTAFRMTSATALRTHDLSSVSAGRQSRPAGKAIVSVVGDEPAVMLTSQAGRTMDRRREMFAICSSSLADGTVYVRNANANDADRRCPVCIGKVVLERRQGIERGPRMRGGSAQVPGHVRVRKQLVLVAERVAACRVRAGDLGRVVRLQRHLRQRAEALGSLAGSKSPTACRVSSGISASFDGVARAIAGSRHRWPRWEAARSHRTDPIP